MSKIHEWRQLEKTLGAKLKSNPRDKIAKENLEHVRQLIEDRERNRPVGTDEDDEG